MSDVNVATACGMDARRGPKAFGSGLGAPTMPAPPRCSSLEAMHVTVNSSGGRPYGS
jgi:hypothetical protein